jgi:hypothetical protein
VDCGGYCPECLLRLSQATMAIYGIDPAARDKARRILGHGSRNRQQPQGKNQ